MPGTFQGTRQTAENKADKNHCPLEFIFSREKKIDKYMSDLCGIAYAYNWYAKNKSKHNGLEYAGGGADVKGKILNSMIFEGLQKDDIWANT